MSREQRKAKRHHSDTIIIREEFSFWMFVWSLGLSVGGIVMGALWISGVRQKEIRGFDMCFLGGGSLCFLALGILTAIGIVVTVVNKHHLALTDTHVKYRSGAKKLFGKIAYKDIHSTKIDYYEDPNGPVRVLFIYLHDGYDPTTKWLSAWHPQPNICFIMNSFRKPLETIQDIIEDRLEEQPW